ncbi:MAG: tRNA pseudouridine(55) synthase, partial [uncultured Craurococcus sp.]
VQRQAPPPPPPQAEGPGDRWLADRRQAFRHRLHRCRRQGQARLRRAEMRPWRHARPAGDRRAAHRPRHRDQDRPLCDGRHQVLPLHAALRRLARHRRRRRPDHRDLGGPADRRGHPRRTPGLHRRHHADPADLLGDQARRRARLRPRPRGATRGTPAPPCPGRPLRAGIPPRRRYRHLPRRERQGRLHALPRPRPGPRRRHGRPYRGAPAHAGRPLPRIHRNSPGQARRFRRYAASFPGPPPSRGDRAGRHPGAGPHRGGGHAAHAGPGFQPGRSHGPHSGRRQPRGGPGARHGGGAVRGALPPGLRPDEGGAPGLAGRSAAGRL